MRLKTSGNNGGGALLGGGVGESRGAGGAPVGPAETSAPAGTGPVLSSPAVRGGENGSASPPPGCEGPSLTAPPPPLSREVKLGAFRASGVVKPRNRSSKRSTHARPGMHMQQCSAVPFTYCPLTGLVYVQADQPSLPGSLFGRVLSAKTSSLHSTILRQLQFHLRTLL